MKVKRHGTRHTLYWPEGHCAHETPRGTVELAELGTVGVSAEMVIRQTFSQLRETIMTGQVMFPYPIYIDTNAYPIRLLFTGGSHAKFIYTRKVIDM